jgi:phage baseplate assembly protein W
MPTTLYNNITITGQNALSQPVTQIYKGFSTVNTTTQNFKLYDFELIKQDLLNSFYVRQGERLMQPTIGCIIWDLLFEPLTPQIQSLITQNVEAIVNADPRVQASNVTITQYDNGLQVEFSLKFTPYNLQENLQLKFDQSNGLSSSTLTL